MWSTASEPGLRQVCHRSGMFREKIIQGLGKVRIVVWVRINWHSVEKSGRIKRIQHGWLLPLKGGRNIWGYCDLNDIFPYWRRKICWKRIRLTNQRVERMVASWGYKPLLDLTFCTSLIREIWFLSGKSQGTNDRRVRRFGDILAPLSRETKLKMRLRE